MWPLRWYREKGAHKSFLAPNCLDCHSSGMTPEIRPEIFWHTELKGTDACIFSSFSLHKNSDKDSYQYHTTIFCISLHFFSNHSYLSKPLLLTRRILLSPIHNVTLGLSGLVYILHVAFKDGLALGLCYLSLCPSNFYPKMAIEAILGLSFIFTFILG